MSHNAAVSLVVIFFGLSTVSFILVIVGLFKPSLVIRKPSLQTRKGVIFVWGAAWMLANIAWFVFAVIGGSNLPDSETPAAAPRAYYVGAKGANIRACPEISCKVLDTIPQNTPLTFPGDLYDKYPDWAEVTMQDGVVGYVSKTTLASEMTEAAAPSAPRADTIMLAPFSYDDAFYIGYTYTISFCAPDSARSGATCGGLAGETQNPVGGTPPYSFVKKSGFLPPGMSLELNGLISGSPTVTGTYNFKLCAKDLHMNEGCQDYTFVVAEEGGTIAAPSSPSEPAPTPQPVTEAVPDYGHTVDSTSCSRTKPQGDTSSFWNMRVLAQGTAWGPVGASVSMSGPGYDHTCGAWTNVNPNSDTGQYCKRGAGDPEKTTWTIDNTYSTELTTYRVFVTSGCCYPVTKEYPFKHTKILDRPCS